MQCRCQTMVDFQYLHSFAAFFSFFSSSSFRSFFHTVHGIFFSFQLLLSQYYFFFSRNSPLAKWIQNTGIYLIFSKAVKLSKEKQRKIKKRNDEKVFFCKNLNGLFHIFCSALLSSFIRFWNGHFKRTQFLQVKQHGRTWMRKAEGEKCIIFYFKDKDEIQWPKCFLFFGYNDGKV